MTVSELIVELIVFIELVFCAWACVHTWGWIVGLVVYSILTSALHCVSLLKKVIKLLEAKK